MHIAKYYTKNNLGIIIITHKEFNYFNLNITLRKKNIIKILFYPFFFLKKIFFKFFLLNLSSKYLIGIHWGAHSSINQTPDWVKFHLSAPGTAKIEDGKFIIPLNSANFIDDLIHKKNYPKIWDILSIAKNIKVKKLDQFLLSIRKIYDTKRYFKVLLVISSNLVEPKNKFYTKIFDDYKNLFNDFEREQFVILKTHPLSGFKGLSTFLISDLLNLSKVFTLFSESEGESRVIKEAQLCGLPVVVFKNLKGGGKDYLNNNNSLFFDNYDEAYKTLIKAVENFDQFEIDTISLSKEISENANKINLCKYFDKLFQFYNLENNHIYVNNNNLSRRLPSHFFDKSIFWANSNKFFYTTTDIISLNLFFKFLIGLKKIESKS